MNELNLYSLMREPPTYASMIVVVEDHCAWGDRTQYLHFDENFWCAKSRKNIFLEELYDNFGIIGWGGNGFHPLRDIVNRSEDVEFVMGRRKGSHEVNPPYIKQLHLMNATLRHLISLGNVPHSLASITSHDKFSCMF